MGIFFSQFKLALLSVCDQMNLFSLINNYNLSISDLAIKLSIIYRSTEVLVNNLLVNHFVAIEQDTLILTELSKTYLVTAHPSIKKNSKIHKKTLTGF